MTITFSITFLSQTEQGQILKCHCWNEVFKFLPYWEYGLKRDEAEVFTFLNSMKVTVIGFHHYISRDLTGYHIPLHLKLLLLYR